MTNLKKLLCLASGAILGLIVAIPALAAPLTYSSNATVSLTSPAINFVIQSGSTADAVTVNSGSMVITVSGTEQLVFTSASRDINSSVTSTTGTPLITVSCSSGTDTVTINANSGSGQFTLTPAASACVAPVVSGGGAGGGGGGGFVSMPSSSNSTSNGTASIAAASGGTVALSNSDGSSESVNIPIGALSSDATVAIIASAAAPGSVTTPGAAFSQVGPYYNFSALTSYGSYLTNFNANLTLTFNYLPGQIPVGVSESSLQVYYYNSTSNTWILAGGSLNPSTHTISVAVSHFTTFAIFGTAGSAQNSVQNPSPASPANTPSTALQRPNGAHPDGTLIQDGQAIYLIQNNQRFGFRDPVEYKSWGFTFSQAVPANDADRAMSNGGILKAFSGTLVLDRSDNRTVYIIFNGTKRGFASFSAFSGLGYKLSKTVRIDLSDYPAGMPINSGAEQHPDGTLVRGKSGTVYWLANSQLTPFPSVQVLKSYGFSSALALPINAADLMLPIATPAGFRDGTLVWDTSTSQYYIISDGAKLPFSSKQAMLSAGYKLSNVIKADISAYQNGSAPF